MVQLRQPGWLVVRRARRAASPPLPGRAGKIFTFPKKFFRGPSGEVKIKNFFKKNFQESIKSDVFQNAESTVYLTKVLCFPMLLKHFEEKASIDFAKSVMISTVFEAIPRKSKKSWLSGKFLVFGGPKELFNFFRKKNSNFFRKKFPSPAQHVAITA